MSARKQLLQLLFKPLCASTSSNPVEPTGLPRNASLWMLAPALSLLAFVGGGDQPVKNGGFEAANPAESWQIDPSEAKQTFSISAEKSDVKEGAQALLISAAQPVHLTLRQQVFLPVGTLWRLTGWVKSSASAVSANVKPADEGPTPGPRFGIEAQAG